jgi:hypothetical protein
MAGLTRQPTSLVVDGFTGQDSNASAVGTDIYFVYAVNRGGCGGLGVLKGKLELETRDQLLPFYALSTLKLGQRRQSFRIEIPLCSLNGSEGVRLALSLHVTPSICLDRCVSAHASDDSVILLSYAWQSYLG